MSDLYSGLRPDEFDLVAQTKERLLILEQGCPPFIVPESADLQNGWDHAGAPYQTFGYRICDGHLQFRGHLMGGASGTVCYTLPADYLILDGNPTRLNDIADGMGGFQVARIEVDMTSGDITITFPAT